MSVQIAELSCFLISPIGNRHAALGSEPKKIWEESIQVWEEVVLPACSGVGLVPVRADQISEVGDINDQIFRKLRDSHVVIADVTGANPNVMYELGLRHTTGKLTVQIGEADRLPFDVSTIRTIMFKRTPGGLIDARRKLAETLASGIEGRFAPVAATRVWLEKPDAGVAEVARDAGESANVTVGQGPGYLELLAEVDVARADMMASLNAMGNVLGEIGGYVGEATQQVAKAGGKDAPLDAKIAISNGLATRLEDPATRLESLANSFAESVRRSDPGTRYVIAELKKRSDSDAVTQRDGLRGLFVSLRGSLTSAEQYMRTISGPAPTMAQGKQNHRIAAAIQSQIEIAPIIEQWLSLLGE